MKRRSQYILDAVYGIQPASQVALGATLGMFVGLIPKDSLLVALACLLILASAANLYSGVLSALVFSIIGWFIDPLLHKLGAVILTNEAFVRTWAELYQRPGVPWTRVNNTVVMGGLVASLILAYPLFCAVRAISLGFLPRLRAFVGHLVQWRSRTRASDHFPVGSR